MEYLWHKWPRLLKKINSHKQILLVLDFDGTLAAISKTPDHVVLDSKTTAILKQLSQAPACKVAIVSGRSIKNLRSYFRMKDVCYAGNHGLELKCDSLKLPEEAKNAKKLKSLVWLLSEKMKTDFSDIPGVLVENKNYTSSVHYRNVDKNSYSEFRRKIHSLQDQCRHWPLVWRKGKKVWEIRPRVQWDKGGVVVLLCRKYSEALPIVIGDDVTDEDMFRTLKGRGITIRVRGSKKSCADYYLKSSGDVRNFLLEILARR